MYELIDLGYEWQLVTSKYGTFRGTFLKLSCLMVYKLDFKPDEIDVAIQDMCQTGNDRAQFGIWKTFVFSYNSKKEAV